MRLDKFLKLSGLIKRRTLAQQMIDIGAVRLNAKNPKPSADVKCGDILEVAYARRIITVSVLTSDETSLKRGAEAYKQIEEKKADREDRPW